MTITRFDNVYISFSGSDKSSTWSTFRVAAVTIPICSADRCRSHPVHQERHAARAGGDNCDGAGDFVDKILRGAKPGDIPVEQPTKFDFVINLTTAKALGFKIPEAALTENRQMASELAFGDRLQSHAFVWPSSLRLTE